MNRRLLPLVALSVLLAASGCLVRGKSQEEKEAEARAAVAKAAPEVPGLSAHWREGTLPPGLDEGTPAQGGTLTVRINGNPPSLTFLLESDFWLNRITMHNLHESLVRPDPRDHPRYRIQPELAASWEESPDHLTYTFRLRDGVTWHDGKPFTARDVKFTFDRLMDPAVRSMHLRQAFVDLESVTTPDDRTVIIRYKQPYVWALEKISEVPILPAHAFEGHEGAKFNTAPYHRAPIGTGPFRFESWEDHKSITFARNEAYWGREAHVDRVIYRVIPEPNVAQQLLLRGEIDLDITLSSEQYVKLAAEPKVVDLYHRVKYFESSFAWIGWNNQRPLFRDARVRRALGMLFDREKVRTALYAGIPELANCVFYHLGTSCDPATKQHGFDPAAAEALLAEAGWRDTDRDGLLDKDGLPFRFTITIPSGNPTNEAMVLLYKQALYRAGIEMELQKIEWSVFSARLRSHEFDACMLAWSGDVEDDAYQVWHSSQIDGGSNYIAYANPELDRMAEQIRGEFDREKRAALFRRFNQIVIDEAPLLPVFHTPRRTMIHRRLRGVYLAPMTFFQVRDMWIDPAFRAGEGA
jgi:peptide/nickel transport system substrate-binding protein